MLEEKVKYLPVYNITMEYSYYDDDVDVQRRVEMDYPKKMHLDYNTANVIETITRKSTEANEANPAIRSYAELLQMGERNLYKVIRRIQKLGFNFGISLNYNRVGMSRIIAIADGRLDLPLPVETVYRSIDGRWVYDFLAPQKCVDNVVGEVLAVGGRVYQVGIEWGSRPALASLEYFKHLDGDGAGVLEDKMEDLFKQLLAMGPPRTVFGRRMALDPLLMAVIAAARRDILVKSIAQIARDLGLDDKHTNRAQRRYYNLWRKRIVLGYRVVEAPYWRRERVLVEVSSNDPLRTAYAAAVLPPVVEGLVVGDPNNRHDRLLLHLSGPVRHISTVLSLVKKYQGNIESITCMYEEERNRDYARMLLEMRESAFSC